jgi:hypothetical protein
MRISRRGAGWLLIVYAVVGFSLAILGGLVGIDLAARVERLTGDADAAMTAAARATQAAADSFASIDDSLADARTSSDAAAALAREASGSLRSLASAMALSIFGAQPLLPLAEDFSTSADQAGALADTLDEVGRSLGDTRADVASIGPELEILSRQLDELAAAPDASDSAAPFRLFVIALLAWLLMQAVGSLLAGLSLIRGPRTTTTVS